ncbi:MAG: hypothetical protein MUD01_06865 [Chloroflexaceae bacterium]|jgi:hypothetical protein|nr:hypothetical protein [Chloroflexaceae bacterium]
MTNLPEQLPETEFVPNAELERAFLEEFLHSQGLSLESVATLPAAQATAIMRAASLYASGHLSEVEARFHLVEELHGGARAV